MKHVAILTTDSLEDFYVYDNMTYPHLERLGWQVSDVSWRDNTANWDDYDVVVVRSTWDYQAAAEDFIACLHNIDRSNATLENSLALITWNISKDYLRALEQQGITIVPSVWSESFKANELIDSYGLFGVDELVVKPWVSANADHTYRLEKDQVDAQLVTLSEVFSDRPYMIQPFMQSVIQKGEYSLFYFSGVYSHTILKVPQQDDFRVQEEHGGQLYSVVAEPELLMVAEKVLKALPEMPLYARIDLVEFENAYALMEVELIEPSLYFNMDEASAERFANALDKKYAHLNNRNAR